ncbi:MAG: hypothetical protein M1837_002312 [Sclerophora amabilis]|nr:MAG: hypothetical protein M1837_002312 [Sclerophora amabilis]
MAANHPYAKPSHEARDRLPEKPDWENFLRVKSKAHRKPTIHGMQNVRDDTRCKLRIESRPNGIEPVMVVPEDGDGSFQLKILIGGGSDCPYFELQLSLWSVANDRLVRGLPPTHTCWVRYYAWTEANDRFNPKNYCRYRQYYGPGHDRTTSPPMHKDPANHGQDFSHMLYDVRYMPNPSVQTQPDYPMLLTWLSISHPVFYNKAIINLHHYPEPARLAVANFFNLDRTDMTISAKLHRGGRGFFDALSVFYAQPVPTIRSYWRYAEGPNQASSIVNILPPVDENMHRVLVKNWADLPYNATISSRFHQPRQILPMAPIYQFADAREYETFISGVMRREVEAEKGHLEQYFNGKYFCSLDEGRRYSPSASMRAYLVKVNLRLPKEAIKANVQLPEENSQAVVQINGERWIGKVVWPSSSSTYNCVLLCVRPGSSQGIVTVSNSHEVEISFGANLTTNRSAGQAIHWLVHDNVSEHGITRARLREQVFARSNTMDVREWNLDQGQRGHLQELLDQLRLNAEQVSAVEAMFRPARELGLVVGPPGTGKTTAIAATMMACVLFRRPVLVTAASNAAADVIMEKFQSMCRKYRPNLLDLSFRFYRHALENFQGEQEEGSSADEPNPLAITPLEEGRLDATMVQALEMVLRDDVEEKFPDHSVRRVILRGLDRYRSQMGATELNPPTDPSVVKFRETIKDLHFAIGYTTMPCLSDEPDQEQRSREQAVAKKWLRAQRAVLARARVVVCTCSTAGTVAFREDSFKPHHTIVDEAGQAAEQECLVPLVLPKQLVLSAVLFGDDKQLRPTTRTQGSSEFAEQAQLSMFDRLLNHSNIFSVRLRTQYRMAPAIASHPNEFFYQGRLVNDQSTINRQETEDFLRWASNARYLFTGEAIGPAVARPLPATSSIFLSVENAKLYRQTRGTSKVNLVHVSIVVMLVEELLSSTKFTPSDIVCLCYYKAAANVLRRCFQQLSNSSKQKLDHVDVWTVDAAQGRERKVVILDVSTPGGEEYALGFVRDPNRQNMALTRARDGLIIIGNEDMTSRQYVSNGTKSWARLVERHQYDLTMWRVEASAMQARIRSSILNTVQSFESEFEVDSGPATRKRKGWPS